MRDLKGSTNNELICWQAKLGLQLYLRLRPFFGSSSTSTTSLLTDIPSYATTSY